jgi:hypothetical protein
MVLAHHTGFENGSGADLDREIENSYCISSQSLLDYCASHRKETNDEKQKIDDCSCVI